MKKFFGEFKKFITRGNVVDMAVGVIVGSSFTAIVNGLSNYILKPMINWLLAFLFGADSLSELYTMLTEVRDPTTNELILEESIYIDWGAFINAVINFFLIALVLFSIVKIINKFREEHLEFVNGKPTKAERKEMKKQGIKLRDRDAVKAFLAEKDAAEKAKKEEEERKKREENPTTEDLLKQIRDLLQNK